VADTARWVALYRAIESERPDAHFQDPYARRLAGPRGEQIMASLPKSMRNASWSVVARTVLIDRYVAQQVAQGVTLVLNLAAGLDTRPYRLTLPSTLTWVEVDQPALLEEKAALLADATPHCALERVAIDLRLEGPRRHLFERLGGKAERVLVLTEGLLMYLTQDDVVGLARDMARVSTFQSWVTDLISPGLLKMIDKDWGQTLRAGGAPMQFAPESGSLFFEPFGWGTVECRSAFMLAGKLKRLPWLFHLFSLLPGGERFTPNRPWSGVCLLARSPQASKP
jgi:methyltransferase (TIGR00027 family)